MMRFHANAVIRMRDTSRVWPALELALRDVTIEVTRSGNLMMLRGLGVGSTSMNHDDSAILKIQEQEDAVFIEAEGVFDGSYLGAGAIPGQVVQRKLDLVFEEIKRQFEAEAMPAADASAMVETKFEPDEALERSRFLTHAPEAFSSGSKGPERKPHPSAVHRPEEFLVRRLTDIPHASFRQFSYLAASIPILALTLGGIYGVERYLEQRESFTASLANSEPAATYGDSKRASSDTVPLSLPIAAQPADHSADPKTLLKRWEDAMRTRDAVAQSAFYADPVDRYQDQAFVTRTILQHEKQSAIADRKGLWTVKLEGIVIEKRMADEVSVRLVKHFIDQPVPFQISEQFVPTQLLLRRVNGDWKIVSERDLAPSVNPATS